MPDEAEIRSQELAVKEREIALRERQFKSDQTKKWYQDVPVLISAIVALMGVVISLASLIATAVIAHEGAKIAASNSEAAIAQANENYKFEALKFVVTDTHHLLLTCNVAETDSRVEVLLGQFSDLQPVFKIAVDEDMNYCETQAHDDAYNLAITNNVDASLATTQADSALKTVDSNFHNDPALGPLLPGAAVVPVASTAAQGAPPTGSNTSPQPSLPAPATIMTVYIQYNDESQRGQALALQNKLNATAGFSAPGVQKVSTGPKAAQLRIYYQAENIASEQINAVAAGINLPEAEIKQISGKNLPAGIVEYWFPKYVSS